MNQNVRLVIEDLAGNIADTDEKTADGQYAFQPGFEFSHQLTVSTMHLSDGMRTECFSGDNWRRGGGGNFAIPILAVRKRRAKSIIQQPLL